MLFLEFDEHRGMALSVHDLTVIPEGGVQIHTMPMATHSCWSGTRATTCGCTRSGWALIPPAVAGRHATGWCSRGSRPVRKTT